MATGTTAWISSWSRRPSGSYGVWTCPWRISGSALPRLERALGLQGLVAVGRVAGEGTGDARLRQGRHLHGAPAVVRHEQHRLISDVDADADNDGLARLLRSLLETTRQRELLERLRLRCRVQRDRHLRRPVQLALHDLALPEPVFPGLVGELDRELRRRLDRLRRVRRRRAGHDQGGDDDRESDRTFHDREEYPTRRRSFGLGRLDVLLRWPEQRDKAGDQRHEEDLAEHGFEHGQAP